jgi:hypothetical protein
VEIGSNWLLFILMFDTAGLFHSFFLLFLLFLLAGIDLGVFAYQCEVFLIVPKEPCRLKHNAYLST